MRSTRKQVAFFQFCTLLLTKVPKHVSLYCFSVCSSGLVRRDVWMKINLNSVLLIGLGSKRIGSHRRISPRLPWLLVTSLMKTFWTFWSSTFYVKRNNDPAFEKWLKIDRDVDINHSYTSLEAVRNERAFTERLCFIIFTTMELEYNLFI